MQGRWWTLGREPVARTRQRAAQLLEELQASSHDTLIVVSHSNFLKRLLADHLATTAADDATSDEVAAMEAALRTRKVPNCGVVVCTLEPSGDKPLRGCKLCWAPEGTGQSATRKGKPRRTAPTRTAKVAPAP